MMSLFCIWLRSYQWQRLFGLALTTGSSPEQQSKTVLDLLISIGVIMRTRGNLGVSRGWSPANVAPFTRPWLSEFPNSREECLQHLRRMQYSLARQQQCADLNKNEYLHALMKQLDQQYRLLKTELCNQLDRVYQWNKLMVSRDLDREHLEGLQKTQAGIAALSSNIQQLVEQLEASALYKQGISETVLEDFQRRRAWLSQSSEETLRDYQSRSYLTVQQAVFQQVKTDIARLFTYKQQRGNLRRQFQSVGPSELKGADPNLDYNQYSLGSRLQDGLQQGNPPSRPLNPESPLANFLKAPESKQRSLLRSPRAQPAERPKRHLQVPQQRGSKLKQSSAQQFNNQFLREFRAEYQPSSGRPVSFNLDTQQGQQRRLRRNRNILRPK